MSDDAFTFALSSNGAWADFKSHQSPDYFPKMAEGQAPKILWLGCADSRVPETTILGLGPGEVFTHRNIANVMSPTDISLSAVLDYSVGALKVEHVILCGHTCCGGAAAALGDSKVGGVLDAWLSPLKALKAAHLEELEAIKEPGAKAIRLAELNVAAGVSVLLNNYTVAEHMKERGLKVHGVIYDIATGTVRNLNVGTDKA